MPRVSEPVEQRLKEIKCRTDVVGVFVNPAILLEPVASVPVEADDEWLGADKRISAAAADFTA